MIKRWSLILMVGLLLAISALPVAAAPEVQGGGGGVHFGPYTLAAGQAVSGDVVVFGGPVLLEAESEIDGSLTVFGALTIEAGAEIDGALVVMGTASIAGSVDGDVFVAGAVSLGKTAYVSGDLASAGNISLAEGAVVEGTVERLEDSRFSWGTPGGIEAPRPPRVIVPQRPFWVQWLINIGEGIANTLVMGLLALLIISIWPQQTERVAITLEEVPLISLGMGLLLFLLTGVIFTLLAITLCLLPVGIIGLIVVGVGTLLGWVALGQVFGNKVLAGVLNQTGANPMRAAVVGTMLLTLILALTKILGPLHPLLVLLLVPPAAGAVLLTRFGSRPYATQGQPIAPTPRAPQPPKPAPQAPIVPAPLAPPTYYATPAEEETSGEIEE